MIELMFLLLPISACSGWYIGRQSRLNSDKKNSQQLSNNYYVGLNYLLNEQPDKAVDALLKVLDLDDDIVETHLALGNLFRRQGKVDRAIRIHTSLLARPTLSKVYRSTSLLELSKDYISAGFFDRAEKILIKLIDDGEYLESSLNQLMDIYHQAKDWQRAIGVARKLYNITGENLDSKIAHFYCELAEKSKQQGELKAAQKWIKFAKSIDNGCARASIIEGSIAELLGKYKRALISYQHAIDKNKRFLSEILPSMSTCYDKLSNNVGMIKYLEKLMVNSSDVILVLNLVKLLKKTKGEQAAVSYLEKYLQEYPSFVGLNELLKLNMSSMSGKIKQEFKIIQKLIDKMLADKLNYKCSSCGLTSNTLQWHCPGCKQWDTLETA